MAKFVLVVVGHKQLNVCNKFGVSQSLTVGDIKNDIIGSKVINAFA